MRPSPIVEYFESGKVPEGHDVVGAVDRLTRHADQVCRLGVQANADTPEDAARARRFGAQGIGLCRTEHMFLGERRALIERLLRRRRAGLRLLLAVPASHRAARGGMRGSECGCPRLTLTGLPRREVRHDHSHSRPERHA